VLSVVTFSFYFTLYIIMRYRFSVNKDLCVFKQATHDFTDFPSAEYHEI